MQRKAEAKWEGTLKEGKGNIKLGSGAFDGGYSFSSRFEDAPLANPEELIGAALAACYSMQVGANLERAGFPVDYVHSTAKVSIEKLETGFSITRIDVDTEARVPNVDDATFQQQATNAKSCIISRALSAVPVNVNAKLVS